MPGSPRVEGVGGQAVLALDQLELVAQSLEGGFWGTNLLCRHNEVVVLLGPADGAAAHDHCREEDLELEGGLTCGAGEGPHLPPDCSTVTPSTVGGRLLGLTRVLDFTRLVTVLQ